tara:strand:+ start:5452 stop:5874 length:423 start_codon:yes stop_codon:yes gene_type:complete
MSDTDDNTTQERTPTPEEELATLLKTAKGVTRENPYASRDVYTGSISMDYTQTVTRSVTIGLSDYMDSGYTDVSEYVENDLYNEWDDEDVDDWDEGAWRVRGYVTTEEYNNLVDIIIGFRNNLALEDGTFRVKHIGAEEE